MPYPLTSARGVRAMRIRLEKIGSEPYEWREQVTIPIASLDRPELLELGEITWQGRVWAEPPGFRLEATLAYEQTIACDRCLKPIVQPITIEVKLLMVQNSPQPRADEIELTADDLEIGYLDGDEFDADQILVEQLQLNVPMRVVCRENCQGLCPRCGVDRNVESCGCEETGGDPRWESLRSLKEPH